MAFLQAADAIELAMGIEKNGEAFYRAVAQKAGSAPVHALFEDLAEQEEAPAVDAVPDDPARHAESEQADTPRACHDADPERRVGHPQHQPAVGERLDGPGHGTEERA